MCLTAMNANDCFVGGVIVALSMIHEEPSPSFIAREMFLSLVGNPDNVHFSIDAVPQTVIKCRR